MFSDWVISHRGLRRRRVADLCHHEVGCDGAPAPEGTARFRLDSRAWRFMVTPGPADDLSVAGYEVDSEGALMQVKTRLEAYGVKVTSESAELAAERGVLGLISCVDPAGTRLEIYYGGTEMFEVPFASPTGVKEFRTDDQGMATTSWQFPTLTRRSTSTSRASVPPLRRHRLAGLSRGVGQAPLPALQWPPPHPGCRGDAF